MGLGLLLFGCTSKVVNQNPQLPIKVEKQLLLEYFKVISSDGFEGRKLGSVGGLKASEYIYTQLKSSGVLPFEGKFKHAFSFNKFNTVIQGNNVIGEIKGTHYPNQYIVLTAHYDHLGKKNNRIYNGADDNASGTSALLIIAKMLAESPLQHSILVLFTDGEESNLKGAKAFSKEKQKLFDDIKLNINLDMLSGAKQTRKLRYISRRLDSLLTPSELNTFKTKQFKKFQLVKGFKSAHRNVLNKRVNWDMASDHWVFHQQGIPFVYYGVGTHHNYHKSSDTYENSNLLFFFNATNAIYQQLLFLDSAISSKP